VAVAAEKAVVEELTGTVLEPDIIPSCPSNAISYGRTIDEQVTKLDYAPVSKDRSRAFS